MAGEIAATQNSGNTGALVAIVLKKTLEKTGAEREEVWGPIAMTNWRETPCIKGRVATEDDAKAGRAVFYLDLSQGQKSCPVDFDLPAAPSCTKKVRTIFPSSSSKLKKATMAIVQPNSLPVITP